MANVDFPCLISLPWQVLEISMYSENVRFSKAEPNERKQPSERNARDGGKQVVISVYFKMCISW